MGYNITKENAAEMQKRGVAKRLENNEKRFALMRSTREQLTAIKKPDDKDLQDAEFVGVKLGKKPTVGETLIVGFLAHLKRIGDVRGFMELLKMSGMTFDQSPEALGGSNNPINLNNRIGPPTDELKKAMGEQARLLGVVDDD